MNKMSLSKLSQSKMSLSNIIEGTIAPTAISFRRLTVEVAGGVDAVRARVRTSVMAAVMAGVIATVLNFVTAGLETAAWAGEEVAIGKAAPDFTLADTDGKQHTLSDYTQKGYTVVLEWFNPDCPYIKKHHLNHKTMNEIYADVKEQKVVWLAINSSAPGKQGHGLEHNQKAKENYKMEMAILLDEDGKVGRLYGAKTTPHMFVIGSDGVLLYNGAIDNDNGRELGEINYVSIALTAYLAGESIEVTTTKPYGCSVKYAQ